MNWRGASFETPAVRAPQDDVYFFGCHEQTTVILRSAEDASRRTQRGDAARERHNHDTSVGSKRNSSAGLVWGSRSTCWRSPRQRRMLPVNASSTENSWSDAMPYS